MPGPSTPHVSRCLSTLLVLLGALLLGIAPASASEGVTLRRGSITITFDAQGFLRWVESFDLRSADADRDVALVLPAPPTAAGSGRGVAIGFDLGGQTGELLDAEAARARYLAGPAFPGAARGPAALFSALDTDLFALEVAGLGTDPTQVATSFLVPTVVRGGRHRITVTMEEDVLLRLRGPAGQLFVAGRPVSFPHEVVASAGVPLELSFAPHDAAPLRGGFSVIPVPGGQLLHLQLQAAPRLSEIPTTAHVVVALDLSRSLRPTDLEASLAGIRAYLEAFPSAEVEVITFAREARRRYGQFRRAAEVTADLATSRLSQANGTRPAEALALARDALRGVSGDRRILLVTDALVSSRRLPSPEDDGIAVQVVTLESGSTTQIALDRERSHPVASALEAVEWRGAVATDGASETPDDRRATFERLVRPVLVDLPELVSEPWLVSELPFLDALREGEGVSRFHLLRQPLTWLEARGWLWERALRAPLLEQTDDAPWAALALTDDQLALTAAQERHLAERSGAVTLATSYLVGTPAHRPLAVLPDPTVSGLGFFGTKGCRLGPGRLPGDRGRWLETALREALHDCGGGELGGEEVVLALETHDAEIAEVGLGSQATPLGRCVVEKAWRLTLPTMFERDGFAQRRVRIAPLFR
ncbi:MAG: VWA domain-containing protein [Polyangiaceae bacterium]